MYKLTAQ